MTVWGSLKVKESAKDFSVWGSLKISLPQKVLQLRGTLKNQSSPCCGEDHIYKYISFSPHTRVTGVGKGRALGLPGPVPSPLPDDRAGRKLKKNLAR